MTNRALKVIPTTPRHITSHPNVQGLRHNPFMTSYRAVSIFEHDTELGNRFKDRSLVTSSGFEQLEKIAERVNRDEPILLNMGDSSTSGWNGEVINGNLTDLSCALFTYRTYSDLLEESFPGNVINAGVPGYTSHQGGKYLKILLCRLQQLGIKPDFITLYFGNNDSTYGIEDKCKIDLEQVSRFSDVLRVTPQDYRLNLQEMIRTIRELGAVPILIVPVVNYVHEPYIRSRKYKGESLNMFNSLTDRVLKSRLKKAHDLWSYGNYRAACELDIALPRISRAHLQALHKVASETETVIINVQDKIAINRPNEADNFFIDYCHPNEDTNRFIGDRIAAIVRSGEQGTLFEQLASQDHGSDESGLPIGTRAFFYLLRLGSNLLPSSLVRRDGDATNNIYPT